MKRIGDWMILGVLAWMTAGSTEGAELIRLGPDEPDRGLAGKEVDWIYGDYLLANDALLAVIGNPVAGRNANMTVRGVGAAVIDLTLREAPNDQLSAFYPAGGRYAFENPELVTVQAEGKTWTPADLPARIEAPEIRWTCRSSAAVADDGSAAEVTYILADGRPDIRAEIRLTGPVDTDHPAVAFDGVRADRTFAFTAVKAPAAAALCSDDFFAQAYGFFPAGASEASWGDGRMRRLQYSGLAKRPSAAGANSSQPPTASWAISIVPGTSPADVLGAWNAVGSDAQSASLQRIAVADPEGAVPRGVVHLHRAGEPIGAVRCDEDGIAWIRLPAGEYTATVKAPGFAENRTPLEVPASAAEHTLRLESPARVVARVTDDAGEPIPCKLTFYGVGGLADPDFGPDSASGSVGHCVYTASGQVRRSLPPGSYRVYISHGPEYDAERQTIEVMAGQATEITASLRRSVDTTGWVSAELHSHSSPSGDNTSDQRGRVENLLAEHLEFAPCTEHNRIDSYAPHLEALGATELMATCTGMELTGGPLPVNHQNAFPLHHHPHTQDGGGPQTDANPITQIERLALWDENADKVVQGNHPNLRQIYDDRDSDGVADGGFRPMLGFMDVVEVHPPAAIFEPFDVPADPKQAGNRMAQWMQLLSEGQRLPGVVNTDAHYNLHGSGWIRNWFRSSTDDPAQIEIPEMIHAAEHGHIVMSTGPFLEVEMSANHQGDRVSAIPGDDLIADAGRCELAIRVQCPNWFDINRVQVFVNGHPDPELNFTRQEHPERFDDGPVRFEHVLATTLEEDAFVIVATIGEGLRLGPAMGPSFGELQPVAVANPIYVDLVGDGFDAPGDHGPAAGLKLE